MKKYLVLISVIAVASTFALLITAVGNAEGIVEETSDDVMINCLGV